MSKKLLLYSHLAFFPVHWEAFLRICQQWDCEGHVIALPSPSLPEVQQQLGTSQARLGGAIRSVTQVEASSFYKGTLQILQLLREVRPDAIWFQAEPTDRWLYPVLLHGLMARRCRIACAVCENRFCVRNTWCGRIEAKLQSILWRRIDCLLATAEVAVAGVRQIGFPASVVYKSLVGGGDEPPGSIGPMTFPFPVGSFVVGFAGRIVEEKGWRVLLQAMGKLDSDICLAVAGGGSEADEMKKEVARLRLDRRVHFAGLLPKSRLWSFYAACHLLAVPSLTRPHWMEQFGGVLADAMAVGLPIVGSNSGSIPEVVGAAGVIVPEDDARNLSEAIRRLRDDAALRSRISETGRSRFWSEYSVDAYARKIACGLRVCES